MTIASLTTVEQLERMGPDARYELVRGGLVRMTPTGGKPSEIGIWIGAQLLLHVRPRGLGRVYGADGGFVVAHDPDTLLVPDVGFVRMDRLPSEAEQERFLRLVPDLVVEVVSATDRPGNVDAKAAMYVEAGARLVWVVEPRRRVVRVYRPGEPVVELGEGQVLDGGDVVPGFRLAVEDVFI